MIHLMFEASWSSTEAFELSKLFSLSERPQFFTLPVSYYKHTSYCKEKSRHPNFWISQNDMYRTGIEDDLGADALMFAALDKVEKNIKKRLTRDNADGISQLKKEFDQINSQYVTKPHSTFMF